MVSVLMAARAQSRVPAFAKVSPDLAERPSKSQGDARVNVIIQFNDVPGVQLDSLLLNLGGNVLRRFQNLNARS